MSNIYRGIERSPIFRVTGAIVITLAVSTIFMLSFFHTKTSDTIEPISPITEAKRFEFKPFSESVYTGMYIRNFPKFEAINNLFTLDAVVWFEFNPNVVSLDQVRRFSFLNGSILDQYNPEINEPTIKRIGSRALVMFDVVVDFKSDLAFHHYPFTKHILTITLLCEHSSPREMIYETNDESFVLHPEFSLSNWKINQMTTDFGYQTTQLHKDDPHKIAEYPMARFHISFSSLGMKNIIIFFVPMLFALLLVLFSLLIPYQFGGDNSYMTGLSSTSFAALIAHRFVIEAMIPPVGYMTTTDKTFMLCLLVTFIPALFHIILAIFSRSSQKDIVDDHAQNISRRLNLINGMLFIVLSVITIIGLYLIFLG